MKDRFHILKLLANGTLNAGFTVLCIGLVLSVPLFQANSAKASSTEELESLANTLSGTYLAARYAGRNFDTRSGALYYTKALESDPANKILLEKSFEHVTASGDIDMALNYARELVKQVDSNLLARIALGSVAIRDRSFSQAGNHFSRIGGGPLGEITKGVLSAWAAHGTGNTGEAIQILSQLSGPNWYAVFSSYHLGLLLELEGRHSEAAAQFAVAYDISRGNLKRVLAHSRALAKSGQRDKALEVLDRYESVSANHPYIESARQLIQQNRPLHTDVLNSQEGAAEFLYGMATAIELEGGENHIAIFLQLSMMLKPDLELANLELAKHFEKRGQYAEAIESFSLIAPDSSLHRMSQIGIGRSYGRQDNLEDADRILQALIDRDPKDLEPALALGNLYRNKEMFERASDIYNNAIENLSQIESHHWRLFYYSGIANERTKNWIRAERDFLLALKIKPNQPMVLNYLGYSWVDRGRNYDLALELITKAVEQLPENGYIVDSLGWVYFLLGRFEEAVTHLERAVDLNPEDPIINDHLGDAFWKVGRRLEARFQWSHARDLDPEPKDLEYILQKLENGYIERDQVPGTSASSN